MRVAVVAERTARHDGGDPAAARLGGLAERLADRGHDVAVCCARWWDGEEPEFEVDGVSYRAVTGDDGEPDRRFLTRLPRALRRFDPDVIHAAHGNALAIHGARLAGTVLRAPLVVDWYAVDGASGWRATVTGFAARVPDLVVTPSRLVETEVRELGRAADGIAVIPNAVDMDAVRAAEPEGNADIVYAGRLDDDANLESLLLALAELRELGWEAVVIGDGPARGRYERQARDLRIDDRVRFLGDQPVERRLALFKGAHVYVHTAHRAPFATDLLWALACGCVGIAEYHARSSAHELVEQRERGIRVTSEDELTDAIRLAGDLPRQSIDESFESFDEDEILERYLERYREVRAAHGLL